MLSTFTFDAIGVRPLLVHNIRLANPLDQYAREMRVINARRNKTVEDLAALARLEFEGGLYINEAGPFIPSTWVEAALKRAATLTRQGTAVERAVLIGDDFPLAYDGPRDAAALWGAGFYDSRMVRINKSRVLRTRPMFARWSARLHGLVDLEMLDGSDLEAIAVRCGDYVGLGDYRPTFGRFNVENFAVSAIEQAA